MRELDVFTKSVLAPVSAAYPDVAGFQPLTAHFQSSRNRHYAEVVDCLKSRRLLELSLNLIARFENLRSPDGIRSKGLRNRESPIGHYATKALNRRLTSLVRDGQGLESQEPEQQHRIRLRAKKLRYMLEPFRCVAAKKPYRAALMCLQEIQDSLGDVNDAKVNETMIMDFVRNSEDEPIADRGSLFAAGLVAAGCRTQDAVGLSRAKTAVAKLAGVRTLVIE